MGKIPPGNVITKAKCLPLLSIDVFGCLLANEIDEVKSLSTDLSVRRFAKNALAEVEYTTCYECWDDNLKRNLYEKKDKT